jgi:regulator of protease activity HflC (stomatin/prohibitin superfamily)
MISQYNRFENPITRQEKMEKSYQVQSGYPIMFLGIALLLSIGLIFTGSLIWIVVGVVGFLVGCVVLSGVLIIEPGQSVAFILFGEYKGSCRQSGFFYANPFLTKKKVSLRAQNLNGAHLKVNDLHGNPIEIAAVVVWQVKDNAQAIFAVEDYKNFVSIQSEAAVRHMANSYPYDQGEEVTDQLTLRDGGDLVAAQLVNELNERLAQAGIEVTEARLSHLAYAPEIASAMLQRQQAAAIVAARMVQC